MKESCTVTLLNFRTCEAGTRGCGTTHVQEARDETRDLFSDLVTAARNCGIDEENPDTCGVCGLHFAECEQDRYVGAVSDTPCCTGAIVRKALKALDARAYRVTIRGLERELEVERTATARLREKYKNATISALLEGCFDIADCEGDEDVDFEEFKVEYEGRRAQ